MGRQRVDGQSGFVLHAHPFSETSLVVDVFSRDHGRLPLLARGARRPRSAMRGMLMCFQPLEIGWFGGGEVRTMARLEWLGGIPLLSGRCLMLGYYLNELLLRMLPREDAHPALFDAYFAALQALARGGADAPELRRFEICLLKELGYGVTLDSDGESGASVQPDMDYHFLLERGPVRKVGADSTAEAQVIRGKTLLDMVADDYRDPQTLQESKLLMRRLLSHHLGGQTLQARRVFVDLLEM